MTLPVLSRKLVAYTRRHLMVGAAAVALGLTFGAMQAHAQDAKSSELVWGDMLPPGLDPHVAADVPMQFYMLNAYDTLYRDSGNPPERRPWLAKSHTVSDDGLTWTFTLNDNAQFHDGSKVTASDVVYSFHRVLALKRGPASAFTGYLKAENITAPDDVTVQFKLDKAYAPFLASVPLVAVVNEDLVKKNEKDGDWGAAWLSSNEAGSGAYMVDIATYRPQEAVDFKRFKDHFLGWSDNANPIDVVRAHPVKETSTRVLALLNGDIHATDSYLPTDQVERVEKAKGVRVSKDESMRVLVVRMNNQKPPFDNVNFRRCISYAFNYDGFINVLLKGYAVRNAGPIPQTLWGSPADLKGYTYDLAKAKQACDTAKAEGAPIGRKLQIHVQSEYDQNTQVAQLLQADAATLGLNIEIVPSTFPAITSQTGKAETSPDMWVHWVSTYFVDPENWIGQMYDSNLHGTWKASSWYKNEKVDKLLADARTETDKEKRRALYEEASRIVVDEAADLWIYNTIQLRGISEKVSGYTFSPVGSGGELRWMSVKN